ncbi:hypothetical protein JTE90_028216 [Oedothorax gibbosus]|uniref:Uncharacterized protein n=1 Tax=Oedothorax gibbosus TaxID=931172 RepID=A0AAV6TUC9_9ARAC|nr:hypothetical protein JTE90_028216 [Oedothorax gibbosus]
MQEVKEPSKKDETPPVYSMVRNILMSVPKYSAKFITPIIDKLKTRGVSWNEKGEITMDGSVITNSNIIDFFSYLMRNSKEQLEPRHFDLFLKAIKEAKIPVSWITNKRLYNRLNEPEDSFVFESVEDEPPSSEGRRFTPLRRKKVKRSYHDLSFATPSPLAAWHHNPNEKWLNFSGKSTTT